MKLKTTLLLLSCALAGCTSRAPYPDAQEPNAAKLRFVSTVGSATLNYYDAANCEGLKAGTLNSVLSGKSERRVQMLAPPPLRMKDYLEIKVKPGVDVYLQAADLDTPSACSTLTTFKPQPGAEYELSFRMSGTTCTARLDRLEVNNGEPVRQGVPPGGVLRTCAGSGTLFPKREAQKPDTAQREQWIQQIVNAATDPKMREQSAPTPVDEQAIAERKAKIGFKLPDAYWDAYRQSLVLFHADMAGVKEETLTLYQQSFGERLRTLDDTNLERLAHAAESGTPDKLMDAMKIYMAQQYVRLGVQRALLASDRQLTRAGELDAKYRVCSKYKGCWRPH